MTLISLLKILKNIPDKNFILGKAAAVLNVISDPQAPSIQKKSSLPIPSPPMLGHVAACCGQEQDKQPITRSWHGVVLLSVPTTDFSRAGQSLQS